MRTQCSIHSISSIITPMLLIMVCLMIGGCSTSGKMGNLRAGSTTSTRRGPGLARPVLAQPVLAQPVLAQPVLAQPVLAPSVLAASVSDRRSIHLGAGDGIGQAVVSRYLEARAA